MNYIRMGRAFDPELYTMITDNFYHIIFANVFFFVFAFRYTNYFE